MFSSSQVPQPSHTAYILPILHNLSNCKHEEQADGGWLIRVSLDVISLCVILYLQRHACVIIFVQYNFCMI
jgi:hypothetical protein